ncbi:MAG: AAA family ATPase, partial [Thermoplasmata archaeon]|nr:AAA family ATPase [Thermoplasmata archaeon]
MPSASAGRGNPELAPPPSSRSGGGFGSGGPPAGSPSGDLFDSVLPPASDIYKGSREILRESYVPARLPHRENQIRQVAEVLSPALRGELPSNLLIYGKIGTGKTAVVQQVRLEFLRRAAADRSMTFLSVNCGNIDTPYSLLQTIGNSLAECEEERIPTGWALDRVQGALRGLINGRKGICLLVLDEIDRLVARSGDGVLYTLSQLNTELKRARLC